MGEGVFVGTRKKSELNRSPLALRHILAEPSQLARAGQRESAIEDTSKAFLLAKRVVSLRFAPPGAASGLTKVAKAAPSVADRIRDRETSGGIPIGATTGPQPDEGDKSKGRIRHVQIALAYVIELSR